MAQVNILNLPVRITLTGNEYVPGQAADGTTQRFTTGQIAALGPAFQIQAALDTIGDTRGDVLFRGASQWQALAPSTAGYVLATQGAGADPAWVANTPTMIFPAAGVPAAAANTALIQAALELAGIIYIVPPAGGIYYINDALVLRSNTLLCLNSGTMRMTGDSFSNTFQNLNLSTAPKSVTGDITATHFTASNRFAICTVNCTNHGYAVGSYVLIKGDTTETYNGVQQVYSVPNANSFTFLLPDGNGDFVPVDSAGSLTATQADAHVWIFNGSVDSNAPGGNVAGGNNGHQGVWNHIYDLVYHDVQILNVNKYAVFATNIWSPRFRDIVFNTGSDGFHFTGQVRDVALDTVSGCTGDDVFAWTPAEVEYPLVDNTTSQELVGVSATNFQIVRSGSRTFALFPTAACRMAGLRLSNINVERGNGPLVMVSGGDEPAEIEDIVIDGFSAGYDAGVTTPVIQVATFFPITVQSLTARGARLCPVNDKLLSPVINVVTDGVITDLLVDDAAITFTTDNIGGAPALLLASAGGSVTRAVFSNCKTNGSGSGDAVYQWARLHDDSSSFGDVCFYGGVLAGNGQLFDHDSAISARYHIGGGLILAGANLVSGRSCTISVDDVVFVSSSRAAFFFAGTSQTYNLSIKSVKNPGAVTLWNYGTTNTINWLAGDDSCPVDPSKITRTTGALYKDTSSVLNAQRRFDISGSAPSSSDITGLMIKEDSGINAVLLGYKNGAGLGLWLGQYAFSASFSNYIFAIDDNGNGGAILNGPGTNNISLRVGNDTKWQIKGSNGFLLAGADNTYDIGASGATRPKAGYFGSNVWSGTVSSALSTLTGATDGFRSSSTNVTQLAAESTTTSGSGGGALVGMYSNDGAAMASGDRLGGIRMGGASSASALRNSAGIFAFADQAWVDASAYGSRLEFQNTTNGATSASTKAILSNAGLFALGATLANTVPALKPSSTTLQARLADDSAYAGFEAGLIGAGGVVSSTTFLNLAAGTTAASPLRFIQGAAPTAPVDGDMWREDNTNTGLKIRINGVTKTITVS